MKKRWRKQVVAVALSTIMVFLTPAYATEVQTSDQTQTVVQSADQQTDNGFVIENGVLKKYTGKAAKVTIPDGITRIGEEAFLECKSVQEVVLPKGIKTIGARAFYDCGKLEKINLPIGLKWIGTGAFGRTNIRSVNFPESIKVIESYLFLNCVNLKKVTFPKNLKKIESSAFEECINLKEIQIPDTVSEIKDAAFDGCKSLEKINIPNSLKVIESDVFYDCSSLRKVKIPKTLKRIEGCAFYRCSKLETIQFSKGLIKNINATSFSQTAWMKKRQKKNPLVIIDHVLLNGDLCEGTVVVPKSVKKIAEEAFSSNFLKLEKIILPEGLEEIGDGAFDGCAYLKEITIPASVKRMGGYFDRCYSLKKITFLGKNTKLDWDGSFLGYRNWMVYGKINSTVYKAAKWEPFDFATIGTKETVKLSKKKFIYNGKTQRPKVTVKNQKGKILKQGKDYTVTYPKSSKKEGMYFVTVKIKGKEKKIVMKVYEIEEGY